MIEYWNVQMILLSFLLPRALPLKSIKVQEKHLTLSQNNLVLNSEGDVHYVKVYTDADNWFVGDYPTWMNVQRVGKDSIRVECGKNLPNSELLVW